MLAWTRTAIGFAAIGGVLLEARRGGRLAVLVLSRGGAGGRPGRPGGPGVLAGPAAC